MSNKSFVLGLVLLVFLSIVGMVYMSGKDTGKKNSVDTELIASTNLKDMGNLGDVDKEGLFYIYADSCVHCQAMKPEITRYLNSGDKLPFKSINLDKAEKVRVNVNGKIEQALVDSENLDRTLLGKVFKKYDYNGKFQGTPTLLYIKGGKIEKEFIGSTFTEKDIPKK